MPRFTVLHVKVPTFQADPDAPVCYAGTVEAVNPSQAFAESQGGMNPQWRGRSTSVGDMLITPNGQLLLIMDSGFSVVSV